MFDINYYKDRYKKITEALSSPFRGTAYAYKDLQDEKENINCIFGIAKHLASCGFGIVMEYPTVLNDHFIKVETDGVEIEPSAEDAVKLAVHSLIDEHKSVFVLSDDASIVANFVSSITTFAYPKVKVSTNRPGVFEDGVFGRKSARMVSAAQINRYDRKSPFDATVLGITDCDLIFSDRMLDVFTRSFVASSLVRRVVSKNETTVAGFCVAFD